MALVQRIARTPVPSTPPGWIVATEVQLFGRRRMVAGDELTIRRPGKRLQRVRFVRHVRNAAGSEWLDVFDGKAIRSVTPDLVAAVHRTRRMGK